ncbi:MAG: hypothetical protein U1F25_02750 [Rubrivivax sp.]
MHNVNSPAQRTLRRRVLIGTLATLAVGGCASTKIEGGLGAWKEVPLPPGDVAPRNTEGSRRTTVVVMPSQGSAYARVATTALEAALSTGGVEVVDRSLADKLDSELRLVEARGSGSYGGPDVADFAIRVVMGNTAWGSDYTEPSSYTDRKTGKVTQIPGGHAHKGSASMTLRIYALPSLKVVEALQANGSVRTNLRPNPAGPGDANGLMAAATEEGIKSKINAVLNEFAPKGYITAKRVKDKLAIFRVQLGKNTGTKTGETVEIWSLQKSGSSVDEVMIGKGRISDIVSADGSWIVVDDEKVAASVRNGDYVKVKRSTGFFN